MGLIADMVEESVRAERDDGRGSEWAGIVAELRRIVEPVVDEIVLEEETPYFENDGVVHAWTVRVPSVPQLRPFTLACKQGIGWRLERRDEEGIATATAFVARYPALVPNWKSAEVRGFLIAQMEPPVGRVWVLASWTAGTDSDCGLFDCDGEVLVMLAGGREMVAALYRLVGQMDHYQSSPRLRVIGQSIELDTPDVAAWHVANDTADGGAAGTPLGDGVLLSTEEASRVRSRVGVRGRLVLAVSDDGMLLVKGDEGWATIDLGALARAVALSGEIRHVDGDHLEETR